MHDEQIDNRQVLKFSRTLDGDNPTHLERISWALLWTSGAPVSDSGSLSIIIG